MLLIRLLLIGAGLLCGLQATAVGTAAASTSPTVLVPTSGALFGAFPNATGGGQTPASVTDLEAKAGRKFDVDRIYSNWSVSEPDPQSSWDVANGIIPLISIDPVVGSLAVPWSQIAAGTDDSTIIAQAQGLAALHAPVLLSFGHEPERRIFSGAAADFVAAWRHYVTVVRQYAPNVSFVFILSAYQYGQSSITNWYPGNAYVDWVGADGYNYFGCPSGQWRDFGSIFAALNHFATAQDKPAVVAEWGSGEDPATPGRKAAWITAAGQTMESWPQFRAASYFDAHAGKSHCNWPLNSSASAMQAFVALAGTSYFNPRPVVALSANPGVGPAPLDVSLGTSGTAGSLNPIASWTLAFGDGTSAAGTGQPPPSVSHSYASGDFSASLGVTDTTGQTNQTSVTVQTASPGVTHPWSSVTSTSQTTLGAAIDPNELDTKCSFDWGLTPSLLQSSSSTNIGAGTKDVPLTEALSGLQPGTTYYWQVEATSAAGTVTSPVATFVTAGRAPSVTSIAGTIDSPTSATLAAQVDPHAVSTQWYFEYGTTTSYGSQSPTVAGTAGNGTSPVAISTTVGSLTTATTYHYAVVAVNAVGKTISDDHVFRTPGPPRVGHERVVHTSSSGQLFTTINPEGEATTYQFQWGTSVPLAHSTAPQSAGSGSAGVVETTTLSGLQPGTTYDWQVNATNAAGTVTSPMATFKTAGAVPSVSALAATLDAPTSATLTAKVDAHSLATQWYFEYGTTTSYGSQSPTVAGTAGNGPSPVSVSTTVGSLTAATKYHYALVAVNALGKTISTDHLFRTPNPPKVGYEHVVSTSSSGQLFATINPEGQATTYWFRWGTSWPLAHSTAPLSAGSGSAGVMETTTLSGLQAGTTYHWDVIAKNAAGGTASPGERFTTK